MIHIVINTTFLKIGIFFEVLFAVVTALIGFYAKRIYDFTKMRKYFLFSFAFGLISAAYIFKALTNILIYFSLRENILASNLLILQSLVEYSSIFYMIALIGAYILLLSVSLNIENQKIAYLLLTTAMVSVLFNPNPEFIFYLLSSLFLAFLACCFYLNYKDKKTLNSFLVFIGFATVLLGQISFIFILYSDNYALLGHVFELIGYTILFVNLIRISRK